jgi:hypothetical protein
MILISLAFEYVSLERVMGLLSRFSVHWELLQPCGLQAGFRERDYPDFELLLADFYQ